MKTTIHITQDILNRSANCTRQDMIGQNCAIGLAIFDLFGGHSWVGGETIDIYDEIVTENFMESMDLQPLTEIPLPIEAIEFIFLFDIVFPEDRKIMPEFSFDIDIPDEAIDMIGIEEVERVLAECPYLDKVEA